MSTEDLLTIEETQHAAQHGWGLFRIYDLTTVRWALGVLPLNHPTTSAAQAFAVVYELATRRDPVATKALQLITRSLQPQPARPSRKKK